MLLEMEFTWTPRDRRDPMSEDHLEIHGINLNNRPLSIRQRIALERSAEQMLLMLKKTMEED